MHINSSPQPPQGPGRVNRALERAGALAGTVIGAATWALPCAAAGAIDGASDYGRDAYNATTAGDTAANASAMLGFGAFALGMAGGGIAFGAGGALLGGLGAGLLALGVAVTHTKSGASEQLGAAVDRRVDAGVQSWPKSGSPTTDKFRGMSQGAILGLREGVRSGAAVAASQGAGLVNGLIEGVRDSGRCLAGKYAADSPAQPDAPLGVGGHLLRLPKYVAQATLGLAWGATQAAVSAVDGAYQGLRDSNSQLYPGSSNETDRGNRQFVIATHMMVGSVVAGAVLGGVPGAFLATVAGAIATTAVVTIPTARNSDHGVMNAVTDALQHARDNNQPSSDPIRDIVRNGVEGTLVGAAAGARAGFMTGFSDAAGAVQSVADGLGGLARGVMDVV